MPGSPTTYLVDGQPRADDEPRRTVQVASRTAGCERRRARSTARVRAGVHNARSGCRCSRGPRRRRSRWATPTRQLPLPQPLLRDDQAQSVARVRRDRCSSTRASRGSTRSPPTRKGKALLRGHRRDPATSPTSKAQTCNTRAGHARPSRLLGLPVLDGSRSACDWGTTPTRRGPASSGRATMPSLFRDDYVTNSNDSYWLSNPEAAARGLRRIIGDERTARTLRTRLGLMMRRRGPTAGRSRSARLQDSRVQQPPVRGRAVRATSVEMCRSTMMASRRRAGRGRRACDVLARLGPARRPRLARRDPVPALRRAGARRRRPAPYSTPFDADDPVNTPRGLNTPTPAGAPGARATRCRTCAARASRSTRRCGECSTSRAAASGSRSTAAPAPAGVFNAINVALAAGQGLLGRAARLVLRAGGRARRGGRAPTSRTILTYSQSTNPKSPFSSDQTRLFSRKEWVPVRFCEKDILADRDLTITRLGRVKCTSRRAIACHGCRSRRRELDQAACGRP